MNEIMMLEFTTLNSVGWPHMERGDADFVSIFGMQNSSAKTGSAHILSILILQLSKIFSGS